MTFLTETKCKIRFIYVGVNRLMEKTILNFHFDYLTPSLTYIACRVAFISTNIAVGLESFIEVERMG